MRPAHRSLRSSDRRTQIARIATFRSRWPATIGCAGREMRVAPHPASAGSSESFRRESPCAVLDDDHAQGTCGDAVVIRRRHVEDAVHADEIVRGLDGVAYLCLIGAAG